jgi:predicted RNA-binding Zn ribbon-like protein
LASLFGSPPPSPIPHDWGISPSIDLVNSRWHDHLGRPVFYDRLLEPRFLRTFLKRWHLKVADVDDPKAQLELARLRAFLRGVLERHASGRPLTPEMRRRLEKEMNRAPLRLRVDGTPRRSGRDWDVALAEIASSAAELIAERRLVKVCANPNCSWMFVDLSRPRTRRWCNTGVCGSLNNVRKYRLAHAGERA